LISNGKSIKLETDRIKNKKRAKGKGTEGAFWRKWNFAGLEFKIESDKGKRRGSLPAFGPTTKKGRYSRKKNS
jgi:hypothetical protein